jgi:murein DD-endopeptidase MepM/ murein hydrolase activator NlpD
VTPRLLDAALRIPVLAVLACLVLISAPLAGDIRAATIPAKAEPVARPILKGKQGEVLYLTLVADGAPLSVLGRFHDRTVPFFKTERPGEFAALVGIDLADKPAPVDLKADIAYPDGTRQRVFRVKVAAGHFRVQAMTLPEDQVDPDAAALKRISLEKEKVKAVFAAFTPERLWTGGFIVPVEGAPSGAFGSKRILNGQPRNQHNGEDISAPLGTPVKASNDGIVRMVDDHFFSGTSVILDHGLGLYTMYFHLDTATVREGERVTAGQVIGTVGQSGRATGPHLHWGTWLNGSRVNPFSLTRLPLGISTPSGVP